MAEILISDPTLRDGNHAVKHQLSRSRSAATRRPRTRPACRSSRSATATGWAPPRCRSAQALLSDREMLRIAREQLTDVQLQAFGDPRLRDDARPRRRARGGRRRLPRRHALHRGRPDRAPHHVPARAGQAGPRRPDDVPHDDRRAASSRRRARWSPTAPGRDRDGLGRRVADRRRAAPRSPRSSTARGRGRLPRARQPLRSASPTRSPPSTEARRSSTAPRAASARAPATRSSRCSSRCCAGSATTPASTSTSCSKRPTWPSASSCRRSRRPTRSTIVSGLAGVFSGYSRPVRRIAREFGVDPRDVFFALGKREVIAGQEDVILEVAAALRDASRSSRDRAGERVEVADGHAPGGARR